MTATDLDDLLFYGVLGVIVGGRLGQVLFYEPGYYLAHPLEILAVWKGGMSFHGGFLGVLAAMALFARKRGMAFLAVTDFIAPLVPLGLGAGRIGNFINGELWGRVADPTLPWAMVFPQVDAAPRHPSQLYQAGLEGLALFAVLWWFSRRQRPDGAGVGAVPRRLRRLPFRRRILPRAGRRHLRPLLHREHGTMADAADDRRRHLADARGRKA